jgi:hypothetical protein
MKKVFTLKFLSFDHLTFAEWAIIIEKIVGFSQDPDALFTVSMVVLSFSSSLQIRLTPVVRQVIEILQSRGLVIKIDNYPRFRLVDDGSFNFNDLQSVLNRPPLSVDQLNRLEAMSILAKRSLSLAILSKWNLLQGLSLQNRQRCLPVVYEFLRFAEDISVEVDESMGNFSLNNLLWMIRQLVID